jgi:hypothetical protein
VTLLAAQDVRDQLARVVEAFAVHVRQHHCGSDGRLLVTIPPHVRRACYVLGVDLVREVDELVALHGFTSWTLDLR